jgi:hypothetical protein
VPFQNSGFGEFFRSLFILQLYFLQKPEKRSGPGLKAQQIGPVFRALKRPAPSGICHLRL